MSRVYHAVIPTKRGLRRAPTRRPWVVNPAGVEYWGEFWQAAGLRYQRGPEAIGGGPRLPHVIAGQDFIAARDRLSELSCELRGLGLWAREYLLPLFETRNAVAVVSDYVELRGATLEELESGKARCR